MFEEATERQLEVLGFIYEHHKKKGYAPSIREIGSELSIRSTNGVNDHLKALERKGLLRRGEEKARSHTVTPRGVVALGGRMDSVAEERVASGLQPAPWIRALPNHSFLCRRCGKRVGPFVTLPLLLFLASGRGFHRTHQKCEARQPLVSAIAAVANNRVIGKAGKLPWHISDDLKRFKSLTLGHTVIMGRRTFERLPSPLGGRDVIVITGQEDYAPQQGGVRVAHSLREALSLVQDDCEVFIAGGSDVYEQALPLVQRIYLTAIHRSFPGDAYFPEVDFTSWRVTKQAPSVGGGIPFTFFTYERSPA